MNKTLEQVQKKHECEVSKMVEDSRIKPMYELLINSGYNFYIDTHQPEVGSEYRFQKRVDEEFGLQDYLCSCNDKVFINVKIYQFDIGNIRNLSAKVGLVHENSNGDWYDLSTCHGQDKSYRLRLR